MVKATKKSTKVTPATVIDDGKKIKIKKDRSWHLAEGEKLEVAVPAGFNFADHKMLKKTNFEKEFLYFEHRAAGARFQAEKFDALAEDSKKNGGSKKIKRIKKLQDKMDELRKQLEDSGVDVEALLSAQDSVI